MTVCRLTLKPAAASVYRSPSKRKILFSGRRWGKTMLMLTTALKTAISKPKSRIYYLAPSRKQAKDITWRTIKDIIPQAWIYRTYESTLTVMFNNRSVIILGGLDYADSLRGQSADLLLLDEFAYSYDLQDAWQAALLPMLSTTDGDAIFASTPNGGGNFSSELWDQAETNPDWQRWNYPTIAGGWVTPEFVEQARRHQSPSTFRQEFYGTIDSAHGSVYPTFSSDNIRDVVDNGEAIIVGIDFNRSPHCCAILQVQGDNLCIIDEIVLTQADSRELALTIREKYPDRRILCCPDPTGSRQQTSSLGLSDDKILKDIGHMQIYSPRAAWAISDKLNALRLLILDAAGQRRLLVNPACKRVVRSIKLLEFLPGKSVPDPKSEHGHMSDAVAYAAIAMTKGLLPWKIGDSGFRLW